ncbi:MAG: monovalent cation:proton antiporter-2 (CPA2) family protein [Bdellovibrionales bacterium]
MHDQFVQVLYLLLAAVIFVPLFRIFKLGAILAYLFAGVLVGPELLKLVKDPETILHFSELGVVFLLFLIGLELQPSRLWKMKREVFGLGTSQVMLTGCAFTGLISLFGFSWEKSFVAGFGLALSSTAFCIQILEEKNQFKTLHGQGTFSVLLFQDLAVVPLITLVPLLAGVTGNASWTGALKALAIIVGFLVFGIYFIRYFLRWIAQTRVQEVFTALSLLVVLGSAILMDEAGLSMGTGAFLAGLLLANSEYRHEIESNLQPFKGLLLGLFFMAVGMSLKFEPIVNHADTVIAIIIAFMSIKILLVYSIARVFGYPYESARNMAFTLPQGGEFAFVLFAAATANQLFSVDEAATLNAAVTISMAVTPLLFSLNQRFLRTYSELTERPFDSVAQDDVEVIVAGYGRFGQIVSRFLKSQSVAYTILEHSAAQVDVARKFGTKIFYGDASREDIVELAGAQNAKIFVLAIDDVEDSLKTAKMVKDKFPHLEIIARVRNRQHAIDLLAIGVTNIHRETYLTSLEVAKEVLLFRGGVRDSINKKLAVFRSRDEEILREQYNHRDDEKEMISVTNQANAELNQILAADVENNSTESGKNKSDNDRLS